MKYMKIIFSIPILFFCLFSQPVLATIIGDYTNYNFPNNVDANEQFIISWNVKNIGDEYGAIWTKLYKENSEFYSKKFYLNPNQETGVAKTDNITKSTDYTIKVGHYNGEIEVVDGYYTFTVYVNEHVQKYVLTVNVYDYKGGPVSQGRNIWVYKTDKTTLVDKGKTDENGQIIFKLEEGAYYLSYYTCNGYTQDYLSLQSNKYITLFLCDEKKTLPPEPETPGFEFIGILIALSITFFILKGKK